jgi:hypothetical protein
MITVTDMVISAEPVTSMPYILARNIANTMRKTEVPSIFMVAPRGIEKLASFGDIPSFFVQIFMFVGMAALLDDSARLVSIPSFAFAKNLKGLTRPSAVSNNP